MVGEGLSIPPVFSFGRISRHSAVNLGGVLIFWGNGEFFRCILYIYIYILGYSESNFISSHERRYVSNVYLTNSQLHSKPCYIF